MCYISSLCFPFPSPSAFVSHFYRFSIFQVGLVNTRQLSNAVNESTNKFAWNAAPLPHSPGAE